MRLPDRLIDTARRLMLAPVVLFGFASIVATGGGGSSDFSDEDEAFDGAITLSPAAVTVQRGQSATVRVDVEGFPDGEGVSGYSIDLSEQASRIDITTAACPAGVGTRSCQEWTISPLPDSIPGEYPLQIVGNGIPRGVDSADLTIRVIDSASAAAPARVVTDRLVIDTNGHLWATGFNDQGQAGVGFWNGCDEIFSHYRCLLPASIGGYVRVGTETWIDAVATSAISLALRSDGTVWAWGQNSGNDLGFDSASAGEVVIRPRQMPGLERITRISILMRGKAGQHARTFFLALTEDGTVHAWGGFRNNAPELVPMAVDLDDGDRTPLNDVVQIAGATNGNSGFGFALAVRGDGSVWQWGGGWYVQFDGSTFTPLNMPARVNGLPEPIRSIAVGSRPVEDSVSPFALAVGSDGSVWTWDEAEPAPVQIAGLTNIVAVDANMGLGAAAALASDGAVWHWLAGRTQPQVVAGLPPIATLGHYSAYSAIAADCSSGGSLWAHFSSAHRIPDFATSPGAGCSADAPVALTITRAGEGTVATDPAYLTCGAVCEALVPVMAGLRMRVTPAPGWEVASPESGDCSDGTTLIVRADTTCAFTFERVVPRTLSISISAGGRVVSDPAGIDCPTDCTHNYPSHVPSVRLTATADPGYRFGAFGGDEDCADGQVDTEAPHHCNVVFAAFPVPATPSGFVATPRTQVVDLAWTAVMDGSLVRYQLDRSEDGAAFAPLADLDGTDDSYRDENVVPGRQYTYRLTAINVSGSSPPATVTTTVQPSVGVTLTVVVTGPGSVSSTPAGINCGSDCTQSYPQVAIVTLSATALSSSRFDGWGGSCAGTAPIVTITVDANRTCTARFVDVSAGGWQTLASDIAASSVRDVRSSVALDQSGLAYIAYLLTVGTQTRLTVRKEGPGFPPLVTFNSFDTWSATGAQLVIDPAGNPVIVFNVESQQIWAARWNGSVFEFLRDGAGSERLNLTANDASRPRVARAGNTLVLAWMEANQIALRRYNLDTRQFDAGGFVPGPTNPFDIDLALDSNGLAVIAWSDGLLGTRLQAIRETSPGTWSALGTEIGVRPTIGPNVTEFGVHVDTSNVIRIVWVDGDTNYFVNAAQFDGANWVALPGRPGFLFAQSGPPLRSLSVNRSPTVFAFAYAMDRGGGSADSFITVQQFVGGGLTSVGSELQTTHPQVGHLSLAMIDVDRAFLAQSQFSSVDMMYRLAIRRHVP